MNEPQSNDERIERSLEGLLSEEQWNALQADVVREPQLREAYVNRVWLHAALRAKSDQLTDLLEPAFDVADVDAMPRIARSRRWPMALAAATIAACVTLAVCLLMLPRRSSAPTVATLVQADNCKWAGSDLPTAVDSQLTAGTLSLVEGIATLQFKSGATITIEAPTKLQIHNAMHCRLIEGTITADVPEPAHGFTIDTPDIQVVDLGTRFGVTAGSTGNSQVRVFEGEVEIGGLKNGRIERLTEGKGMHVGSTTVAPGEPMRAQPVQEVGGWTAISTSFGRGKDAYARRGDHGAPLGGHPLIIVKHSDLKSSVNNERRAVITFDLSQATAGSVSEAQIVLDPEPSGFGFSALVPDSRFAVYGLTDETLDAWDEQDMRWSSVPGCADSGPNPSQAQRLAEFWIPRGGSGESLVVHGQGLAEFIRRDTNGLVSFLIIRETGESESSGVAHGFAAKEHPTARPPTLRLK